MKGTADGVMVVSAGSEDLALARCRAPVNLNRGRPRLSIVRNVSVDRWKSKERNARISTLAVSP